MKNNNLRIIVFIIIWGCNIRPAFTATAAVPTAGLAATSIAVGGTAILGGGWLTKIAGLVVGVVDPASATFYEGKIVLAYPEELLEVVGVGWFGEFSADPSAPTLPVITSPFFDFDSASTSYDFLQPANADLDTSVSVSSGVITIDFNSRSGSGITVTDSHFNLLSVMYKNISGHNLVWNLATTQPANFFSKPSEQVLICRPDPNSDLVGCGDDTEAFKYHVSPVPIPAAVWLFCSGLIGLIGIRKNTLI